jgi:UDP-N-acetylmuramate--alanine ligase
VKIFFSGIGGSGVSAIAGFAVEKGHSVSGSDRLFDRNPGHETCRRLRSNGITIFPQDGSGIDVSTGLAVFSTAVEKDNPDYLKAREAGVPVRMRPEYLAEIVSQFRTIAVAGTSGKSTMSGMLAYLMDRLGMGPNFIGGGRVKQFKSEKNSGNYLAGGSDRLIIEACESDGSLVDYRPEHSIIANLDLDHHPVIETARMFERLAENTSGLVLAGGDDGNLAACNLKGVIRFSIEAESEYRAHRIEHAPFSSTFSVNGTRFELSLPGRYNVYNALACIACLSELGVSAADIAGALPGFSGIERRFDIHLNDGRYIVIDDYAHNPHKISSLMRTMQGVSPAICYVFQPHGYGPTRMMRGGYIRTFSEGLRSTDRLALLPIYYAGGTAAKDISSRDIAEGVAASGGRTVAVEDRSEILAMLGEYNTYVVLGARDDTLSGLAAEIASKLR